MMCSGCKKGWVTEFVMTVGAEGTAIPALFEEKHPCHYPHTCTCQHRRDAQYLREVVGVNGNPPQD